MSKRRGLGRGLNALIPEPMREEEQRPVQGLPQEDQNVSRETSGEVTKAQTDPKEDAQYHESLSRSEIQESENPDFGILKLLNIEEVENDPNQPRRGFDPDALQDLADSIRSQGLLQPIVVNRIREDQYRIVAGARR